MTKELSDLFEAASALSIHSTTLVKVCGCYYGLRIRPLGTISRSSHEPRSSRRWSPSLPDTRWSTRTHSTFTYLAPTRSASVARWQPVNPSILRCVTGADDVSLSFDEEGHFDVWTFREAPRRQTPANALNAVYGSIGVNKALGMLVLRANVESMALALDRTLPMSECEVMAALMDWTDVYKTHDYNGVQFRQTSRLR